MNSFENSTYEHLLRWNIPVERFPQDNQRTHISVPDFYITCPKNLLEMEGTIEATTPRCPSKPQSKNTKEIKSQIQISRLLGSFHRTLRTKAKLAQADNLVVDLRVALRDKERVTPNGIPEHLLFTYDRIYVNSILRTLDYYTRRKYGKYLIQNLNNVNPDSSPNPFKKIVVLLPKIFIVADFSIHAKRDPRSRYHPERFSHSKGPWQSSSGNQLIITNSVYGLANCPIQLSNIVKNLGEVRITERALVPNKSNLSYE